MPTLKSSNKTIGITLGDPAGIGPEVVAKALAKTSIRRLANFKIIGDGCIYKKYSSKNFSNCELIDTRCLSLNNWKAGSANRQNAIASIHYLNKALELITNKEISALVTAPICKESISKTYANFQGHTEYLADAVNIKNVGMMFVAQKFKIIIVTRHLPLNKISQSVTPSAVLETIQLTNQALQNLFKIKNPKLAVCGLNPHAGEGGTIGREEIETIIPALKKARRQNIDVTGPLAADTLFTPEKIKQYDAFVAMYHDQGLIPIKTLAFKKVVNLTIGLPFIRTSPSHGTAFDIAGKNKADPSSMCEAIKLAINLTT